MVSCLFVLAVPVFAREHKWGCVPMVEPRENRVPIMMSDAEVSQVDDWRFENGVATRADAARRLVQIGLGLEADASEIGELASR